jgi:hypothetical protein
MLENMDVFVAISGRLKSSVYMLVILVVFGRDVMRLSKIISDVVLIGMKYCASILFHEFILSSKFSVA